MVGLLPMLPAVAVPAPGGGARRRARQALRPVPGRRGRHGRGAADARLDRRRARRRGDDPQPAAAGPARARAARGPVARTRSSRRTACGRCRGATSRSRSRSRSRATRPRSTTSPASRRRTCSAATRTGAARSGSRSTTCSSSRCCAGTRRSARRSPSSTRPAPGGGCACATWPPTCPRASSRSGCPDADGHRPVAGSIAKFRDDPEWRDLLLFHEYFHGDTGAGIGASHQTGWTGLVAHLLCRGGPLDAAGSRELVGTHRAPEWEEPHDD